MKPWLPLSLALVAATPLGCRDELRFTTGRMEVFSGELVDADFLRVQPDDSTLLEDGTQMALSLDMDNLDDAPGFLTTSDGLFDATPLVTLPAISFDRLSALEIPGGFLRSLLFLAPTSAPELEGADAVLFVSLGQDGRMEVRVLAGGGEQRRLYGLFRLRKEQIEEE